MDTITGSQLRPRLALGVSMLIALAAAFAALPARSPGFGTVTHFGQSSEHERMTRWQLTCPPAAAGATASFNPDCFEPLTLDEVAGKSGTFGAVGAPDKGPTGIGGETFVTAAHCDDGDFLPRKYALFYRNTRAEADEAILACRRHFRQRFGQGLNAALKIVDEPQRGVFTIKPEAVALGCPFSDSGAGSPKCVALEGFGRALHGVQDFYSHSNWADHEDPAKRIGIDNPPGMGQTDLSALMNMRRPGHPPVPLALITGCFGVAEKVRLKVRCIRRVAHRKLNKDEGTIDPVGRTTSNPTTDRGKIAVGGQTNFDRAVRSAVSETERLWRDFRTELTSMVAAKQRAALIICALARDDPVKTCQGRRLAIVIDSSGSNLDTDPKNLRITAGMQFNSRLVTAALAGPGGQPDLSAVVDFDDSARVVSPLDDPSKANFSSIDSSGGTNIASGIAAGIDELTKDSPGDLKGRGGIVVLTDGQDSSVDAQLAQLKRASGLGIRVNYGFLSPPSNPLASAARARKSQASGPPPELVQAILDTGGFFGTIDSAEAQERFVQQVEARGATDLNDPNGQDDGGRLISNAGASGAISDPADRDIWNFAVGAGRRVAIRVKSLGGALAVGARDVRTGRALVGRSVAARGEATLTGATVRASDFDIAIRGVGGTGPYEIAAFEAGVDLNGSGREDNLRCTDAITFVRAGAGNDRVSCGAGADIIVGGPGADRLLGGAGDDIFVVRRRDLLRGVELIDGGAGTDTVVFESRAKPRRTNCRAAKVVVPVGRRARFVLRNVEVIRFGRNRCRG